MVQSSSRYFDAPLCGAEYHRRRGFTLIELLVVVSIISLLLTISMPVAVKARRQARKMKGMANQRQIVNAANLFALDNNGRYPPSVATIGIVNDWHWQEPTMLTGYGGDVSPRPRRSMSAYLREYIQDATVMFCPNAPVRYKHLRQAWAVGDEWDNPDTGCSPDPVKGVYCFYWNYKGYLVRDGGVFKGPQRQCGGRGTSKLLVSCYFGYDHWRSRGCYGSCERMTRANSTEGSDVSSAYWSLCSLDSQQTRDSLNLRLHAGYVDGHVEGYTPGEVVPMKVSITADGACPYPDDTGPGVFYLPRTGVH